MLPSFSSAVMYMVHDMIIVFGSFTQIKTQYCYSKKRQENESTEQLLAKCMFVSVKGKVLEQIKLLYILLVSFIFNRASHV